MGYLSNFIVYTLAMVGVMMLALIVFKRTANGGTIKSSKCLKVLDTMSLGPRKTLYIVSAGEEKFLIAGDVDKTTLISKLSTQATTEERIPAVASMASEDFSTKSFGASNRTSLKAFYIDKSVVGIRSSQLNPHGMSENSVMRNLVEKMNSEIGGCK